MESGVSGRGVCDRGRRRASRCRLSKKDKVGYQLEQIRGTRASHTVKVSKWYKDVSADRSDRRGGSQVKTFRAP